MPTLETLETLRDNGLLYATEVRHPEDVLAEASHRFGRDAWLTALWSITGQLSGHEWCVCSQCGEARLMKPIGLANSHCLMTYGCRAPMVRILKRPTMTKNLRKIISEARWHDPRKVSPQGDKS